MDLFEEKAWVGWRCIVDSQCGSLSGFPRKRILMKLLAQFQRSITFVWVVISWWLLAFNDTWKLWQLLNGDINSNIYIEQLLRYVSYAYSKFVCKLKKALLRLKQALKACYSKIIKHFVILFWTLIQIYLLINNEFCLWLPYSIWMIW